MAQIAAAPRVTQERIPAQIELGITPDEVRMPDLAPLPAGKRVGFELGWDYAHHGVTPPVEHLFSNSPLRQGWQAGQATFGRRTLKARSHTLLWLQLRTHAWTRGRHFETLLLTPNYLQQLDTDWCPITRHALDQRSVDRVRDDAGYAAGNLAVMSHAANRAKASHGWAVGSGSLTTYARIDNLTDQRYVGSVIVNQASSQFYEPAPGRNWTLGLRLVLPL